MIYIVLILILVGADQLSKYLIDTTMFEGETLPFITNFFHITYVKNRGIAFGLFQGKLDIIGIATIIAIVAIAYYLYKERNKLSLVEKMGFIYILAGAIGNMIDRVFRGYVIDMIDFRGIWSYIFNLADVWINIGVIFIILDQLFRKNRKKNEEDK
ncbi:Lipoprotein signal peptidase [Fusobacterium sp. DD29]|uniref:signal peptidase II n=1 Tax=unclassified Fusobacterium TaxID=2648384 RepID=UPI001B8AAD02|nr:MULTISPECIES: signal peptidase II [unclassified Fusobacterium]MBR8701840.1 Lipoprotein signal peptidase [Fusobacterium sp. DD45]MBR8711621.1 Lipoprotein signal peptidase [Fusobacterium sp. DD28]MBR8750052.1 Lipoprotein signal peptidase [Fusobacterium sp. DD29]MBR8752170.1 Lipoprotein signal peptidase [Fusobacterium sp. DD26]MBR8762294.1 Lipoprotein signal peptidase [Fusobacterium sp. DD25]